MAKRTRLSGISPLARASARSKVEDVEKILKDADSDGDSLLSLEELQSYLGDYLGYGQLEIRDFFNEYKSSEAGKVDLAGLQRGFARLNPYLIGKRQGCSIWRKPGSVGAPGAQMNIEDLVDCKVYICDKTEQTFVDECSACEMLIGPCEGATFIRDCKNCTFWVATRQLRTRNCTACQFFLHSHTEPIIEASKDLGFAPFAASYTGLAEHMAAAKMDPGKNFWNAIYDFTGRSDGANWRILDLKECRELEVHLEDSPGEWQCPSPDLSYELLCAAPLKSDEASGQSMTQIPQTRPQLPESATGVKASREVVGDEVKTKEVSVAGPSPGTEHKEAKDASGYPGKTPKPRKPKWMKVKGLRPDSRGVNLFVKVVLVKDVVEDGTLKEVVVGDETATVILRARGPQVDTCQPGAILRIQNALIVMFKGFMRLEVNKWGVMKVADEMKELDVNEKTSVSEVEYEQLKT